jgi:phosphate uptake regulator
MLKDSAAASDWARQLHERLRRDVLRRILATDSKVDAYYKSIARDLRRDLGASHLSEAQVQHFVERALQRAEEHLLPLVERDLEHAAERGNEAAARTLRLIRGGRSEAGEVPFAGRLASGPMPRLVHPQPKGSAED